MRRVLSAAVLLTIAGCGLDQQEGILALLQIQSEFARLVTPVPDEIPAKLSYVQSDRARFSGDDHPLRDVVTGTVLDDVSKLQGCWGRYVRQEWVHLETGETLVIDGVDVLEFDLSAGHRIHHAISLALPPRWDWILTGAFAASNRALGG